MTTSLDSFCDAENPCPRMHTCIEGVCVHTLLDFSVYEIVGILCIMLISGVSSLAGLGGGGPMVSILLQAYNYTPKKSTLLIYALILGATVGNVLNQATTSIRGKTMIKYRYAFVTIPFMFLGSLFGVIINKFFPSLFVCLLIMLTSGKMITSIYKRFRESYDKETMSIQENGGAVHRDF